jgi:anaerobic ribonucleoside-triphosphate reductase activating protein
LKIYLSRIIPEITSLGPGRRIGLWVKGCSLNCRGCMSRELAVRQERDLRDMEDILQEILILSPKHTGITVTGGEPFEQAPALTLLFKMICQYSALDILVYSGLTLEQIRTGTKPMQELLEHVDVLVDGPYRQDLPTKKIWRGSDNQEMHILNKRAMYYHEFMKKEYNQGRPLQVAMDNNDSLHIIGIPETGFLDQLKSRMQNRGVILY